MRVSFRVEVRDLQDDVLALRELVAFHHLLRLDRHVVLRAHVGRQRAVVHVAWRVVKERSLLSVAAYSLTGMFKRPNAIAPPHKARAMAGSSRRIERKAPRCY